MDKFNRILIERRFCRLVPPEDRAVTNARTPGPPAIALGLIGSWIALFSLLIWIA